MKRNYTENKLIIMLLLLASMAIGIGIGLMFNESSPDYWGLLKDVVSIALTAVTLTLAHLGLKTWKTQHVFLERYKSITSLSDSVFEISQKVRALESQYKAFYIWSTHGPDEGWDSTIKKLPDLDSRSKAELRRLRSNIIRDVHYWSRGAKEAEKLLSENDYKENSAYSSCAFYTSELKNNALKSTRECLDYLESLKNDLLNQ